MEPSEILESKKNNLYLMKDLADSLERLVSDDNMQDFFVTAKKREKIRQSIESEDKRNKAVLQKAAASQNGRIISLRREISEIIEYIIEVDKKIELILSEKKSDLLTEIKGIKKGRNAVKSYGNKPQAPPRPRFIKRIG